MVSGPSRLRRDDRSARQRQDAQAYRPSSASTAAGRTEEMYSPEDCYTVTYDRQSRLQTYYYHPFREYTF